MSTCWWGFIVTIITIALLNTYKIHAKKYMKKYFWVNGLLNFCCLRTACSLSPTEIFRAGYPPTPPPPPPPHTHTHHLQRCASRAAGWFSSKKVRQNHYRMKKELCMLLQVHPRLRCLVLSMLCLNEHKIHDKKANQTVFCKQAS